VYFEKSFSSDNEEYFKAIDENQNHILDKIDFPS